MPGRTYVLRARHSRMGDLPRRQVVFSADGTVDLKHAVFPDTIIITKGTACAITLGAPTAGAPDKGGHDGLTIRFISTTAAAHTVTNTTPGFNNGSTASDVATFGAAIGNHITIEAYNGIWYIVGALNVTAA